MLADINGVGLDASAAVIKALGRRAVPVVCDVSEPEQIRAMFGQLDREFGHIDILGNVAGEGLRARPEEIALEQVQKVIQVLVVGRFCCCQEAGRRMLAAGRGSILNIGSLASVTALGRGHIAYSVTTLPAKAGSFSGQAWRIRWSWVKRRAPLLPWRPERIGRHAT
jgi:NAD(P)-dependent dehydrogenase (short-subunit alcohol dehydrogenase family)